MLDMLEEQAAQGQPLEAYLLERVKKVLPASQRFARSFPFHLPSFHRSRGRYLWLTGKHKEALAAWQKSLELAREHHQVYAEAMAHFELGCHTTGDERQEHLQEAATILTKIGASYDLQRIPALARDFGSLVEDKS
jgi:tetratricopeptide (TPR) repeat protein